MPLEKGRTAVKEGGDGKVIAEAEISAIRPPKIKMYPHKIFPTLTELSVATMRFFDSFSC
jgi:hypothetical protein